MTSHPPKYAYLVSYIAVNANGACSGHQEIGMDRPWAYGQSNNHVAHLERVTNTTRMTITNVFPLAVPTS